MQHGVFHIQIAAVARRLSQGGAQSCGPIAGQPHQVGALIQRTPDCLANPESGVGGKLEALAPVELVYRVLQAEVAFLDEVEQLHAGRQGITAGHAHHQAQVGADEMLFGFGGLSDGTIPRAHLRLRRHLVGRGVLRKGGEGLFLLLAGDTAVLYGLRELALLLSVQQRDEADLVEILAN